MKVSDHSAASPKNEAVQSRLRQRNKGHLPGMTDGRPGTILITGVAGFGGSSLINGLRELGYRVTGLDVTPPSHTSLLQHELVHSNFRYAWRSLQDIQPGDLDEHFVVVHLAAQADTPPPSTRPATW